MTRLGFACVLTAMLIAPLVTATAAPAATAKPAAAATDSTTAQVDAYHDQMVKKDAARVAAMASAVELAKKALEAATAAKQEKRVPLLERQLRILKERLDLLTQIGLFRKQKFEAERAGDIAAKRSVADRMEAAYTLIRSRQADEREIREKLGAGAK